MNNYVDNQNSSQTNYITENNVSVENYILEVNATNFQAEVDPYWEANYTAYNDTWSAGATNGFWITDGETMYNSTILHVGIGADVSNNMLDVQGGLAVRGSINEDNNAPEYGIYSQGSVFIGGVGGIGDLDIYEAAPGAPATIRLSTGETGSGASDGYFLSMTRNISLDQWLYEQAPMVFATNDTEALRIEASGLVHANFSIAADVTINATVDVCIEGGNCLSVMPDNSTINNYILNVNSSDKSDYYTGVEVTAINTSMTNYVNNQNSSQTNYIAENNASIENYILEVNATNSGGTLGTITGAGTSWYISAWNGTNSLNNSVIYQDNTNISIGGTVATHKLVCDSGDLNSPAFLGVRMDNDNRFVKIGNPGTDTSMISWDDNDQLVFGTEGSFVDNGASSFIELMRIEREGGTDSALIGINNSDPQQTLSVRGELNVTSNVTIGGGTIWWNGSYMIFT